MSNLTYGEKVVFYIRIAGTVRGPLRFKLSAFGGGPEKLYTRKLKA